MDDKHPDHGLDISEDQGVRYLHFGSEWVQGAMRIRRPWALELDYTRDMMAGLLLHEPPWPGHALLVGLGAGSLAKFLWRNLPATRTTVFEIDPRIPVLARHFFRLPEEDERLKIRIGDGAELMARSRRRHDLILVDGFDHEASAGALDSLAFYRDCRERMARDAVFVTNLFGDERGFRDAVARIEEAFAGRVLALPPCPGGNVIVIAVTGTAHAVPLAELRRRAETIRRESGLDLRPTLTRLRREKTLPDGILRL